MAKTWVFTSRNSITSVLVLKRYSANWFHITNLGDRKFSMFPQAFLMSFVWNQFFCKLRVTRNAIFDIVKGFIEMLFVILETQTFQSVLNGHFWGSNFTLLHFSSLLKLVWVRVDLWHLKNGQNSGLNKQKKGPCIFLIFKK